MSATSIAPWRPKVGLGQSLALSNGAAASFASKVGANTYAIALSAVAANCLVCVSANGTAASATGDILVKDSDPPLILMCAPGDTVSAWGLATGGTLYLSELTH